MVTTTVSSAMVSVGTTMMALASFSRISLKEHYARCIHNEHNYFDFVSAGEGNTALLMMGLLWTSLDRLME